MPLRIITVAFDDLEERFQDEELRAFLIDKRMKSYKAEFLIHCGRPYWSVLIEYEETERKDDERPVEALDEKQKLLLEKLRYWRKEKAQQLGVPVYVIFSNSQMYELARKAPHDYESMKGIRGIGDKKIKNFGKEVLDIVQKSETDHDQ